MYLAIWIGVNLLKLCPITADNVSEIYHSLYHIICAYSLLATVPCVSPASSIPVLFPNPYILAYSYTVYIPNL